MPTKFEEAAGVLKEKRGRLQGYFAKKGPDGTLALNDTERGEFQALSKEIDEDLGPKFLELKSLDASEKRNKAELDYLNQPVHPSSHGAPKSRNSSFDFDAKGGDGSGLNEGELYQRRLGDAFLSTKSYRGWVTGGAVGEYRGGEEVGDFNTKTLFSTTAGFSPFVTRQPGAILSPQQQPKVVDLIPTGVTSEAAIKYMLETTYTDNAAETAEGGNYPESALAYTEETQNVRKIATFLPVTDEQLADAPQTRDIINNRLDLMLRQRFDSQLLNGDATGVNLLGLKNVSGINTQARGTDPGPDAIFKAMTKLMTVGFCDPTGIVMNPTDWQNIRLLKTQYGSYIWGHPAEVGPKNLWGLPVVTSTYQTLGAALVADFMGFTQIFYRTGIEFLVSNSHASNFIAGILAIRAQFRACLVCYRATAIAAVSGL